MSIALPAGLDSMNTLALMRGRGARPEAQTIKLVWRSEGLLGYIFEEVQWPRDVQWDDPDLEGHRSIPLVVQRTRSGLGVDRAHHCGRRRQRALGGGPCRRDGPAPGGGIVVCCPSAAVPGRGWGLDHERARSAYPACPSLCAHPKLGNQGTKRRALERNSGHAVPDCLLSQSAHDTRSAACYRAMRKQLACTARLAQTVEYLLGPSTILHRGREKETR